MLYQLVTGNNMCTELEAVYFIIDF